MNNCDLRLRSRLRGHLLRVLTLAKEAGVQVSRWEEEEIEDAFESGYRLGYSDGNADATRRETPEGPEAA